MEDHISMTSWVSQIGSNGVKKIKHSWVDRKACGMGENNQNIFYVILKDFFKTIKLDIIWKNVDN